MFEKNICDNYNKVDFSEAKKIMDNESDYILIDVRTEEEFIIEHAAGALLFPLDDIDKESLEKTIPDKNTTVLIYCRSGRRSKLAADILLQNGYKRIIDIGGLVGWPYGMEYGL